MMPHIAGQRSSRAIIALSSFTLCIASSACFSDSEPEVFEVVDGHGSLGCMSTDLFIRDVHALVVAEVWLVDHLGEPLSGVSIEASFGNGEQKLAAVTDAAGLVRFSHPLHGGTAIESFSVSSVRFSTENIPAHIKSVKTCPDRVANNTDTGVTLSGTGSSSEGTQSGTGSSSEGTQSGTGSSSEGSSI